MRNNKKYNKIEKTAKGITLIALVITIIVLLILAGITINLFVGNGGIIGRTTEAGFKQKMSEIAEEWALYAGTYDTDATLQNSSGTKSIYAGELLKEIIQEDELDIDQSNVQDIRKLIKKVGSKEEKYVIIHEGELYYVSQTKIANNKKQEQWCREIGIKIWEFTPSNSGIKVTNGNYENINGMYVCTPKLNTGFVKEKTRYLKQDEKGNLVPTNWITKKPDLDWYDYKEKKWANLYVESSGLETYYVWIPRYVYKIADGESTDVKFVDLNNNYKDGQTEATTSWSELQAQGYKIPEAFYWGDSDNIAENTPIPGYWITKYQLNELKDEDTYMIDFRTAATPTTITIQNIETNTQELEANGKRVAKYTYALNGNIVHESDKPEDFKITGLARGNKAINVSLLDEKGQIIGSMTKLYEVADVNEPDLTGFDRDTTFYVYWDENGKEHNHIPISQPAPDEWYDYTIRNWANIVTRNNGLETYFVWIPRYQYALDTVSQKTYVKFIKGTDSKTDAGYRIPEAFTWGDDNQVQLKGYWITKYQVTTDEGTPKVTAQISAGSNKIQVKTITGTEVANGLKYEYYLNGEKKHEGTNPEENYKYTGLETNKTYTVNVIARNAQTDEYVGAITQKVETIGGNAPDLTGFKETNTYYVLYDENGNETIGENIKNDGKNAPDDWYEYSERRWANIVVTDGTVENGKIQGATMTSYFVWIPRYQYSLDTVNQKTNVKFIEGIDTKTEAGYRIPEAFTWGDNGEIQLRGYWISKYQLSNN